MPDTDVVTSNLEQAGGRFLETEVVALTMRLNPGQAEAYKARHDAIWPELARALLESGVKDYRIFLDTNSDTLFATMTRLKDHNLDTLRESELMKRWWVMMSDIMETNTDCSPREQSLLPMFELCAPSTN